MVAAERVWEEQGGYGLVDHVPRYRMATGINGIQESLDKRCPTELDVADLLDNFSKVAVQTDTRTLFAQLEIVPVTHISMVRFHSASAGISSFILRFISLTFFTMVISSFILRFKFLPFTVIMSILIIVLMLLIIVVIILSCSISFMFLAILVIFFIFLMIFIFSPPVWGSP